MNVLKFTRGTPVMERVVAWNRKRNGLNLDLSLEAAMLSEESAEFYHAGDTVDRIDAYCDFLFVALGTIAKMNAMQFKVFYDLVHHKEDAKILTGYINDQLLTMLSILEIELDGLLGDPNKDDTWNLGSTVNADFLTEAMDIVVTANENKGTEKNAAGKVQKGATYQKPEPQIDLLLSKYIQECRAKRTRGLH